MKKLDILIYPDRRLKEHSFVLTEEEIASKEILELAMNMEHTIKTHKIEGVGMAAVQVNVMKQLIIYRAKGGIIRYLCNPKIITATGHIKSHNEGCMSVPGLALTVRRYKKVTVNAIEIGKDMEPTEVVIKEQKYPAIILQHEIDHLFGIEFLDRVKNTNPAKREYVKRIEREQLGAKALATMVDCNSFGDRNDN